MTNTQAPTPFKNHGIVSAACLSILCSVLIPCNVLAQSTYPVLEALVPRLETYPNLSPNNRYLVFSSGDGFDLNLYRLDLETKEMLQLTDNEFEDSAASWSPDGKKIIFQREDLQGHRDIWQVDATGSTEQNLTNTPEHSEQHPRYAPGGSSIVFDSNRASLATTSEDNSYENYEIYMLSLRTDSLSRLTTWGRWDMYPSLSPDENRLVWRRALPGETTDEQNFEIFVKDLATGRETNVTNHAALDTNPHWSPSGEWIVFASNRDGSFELYVMRPDGSDLRRITNGGSRSIGYGRPSFSANGDRIVANRFVRGVTDMVIIDFPGESDPGPKR